MVTSSPIVLARFRTNDDKEKVGLVSDDKTKITDITGLAEGGVKVKNLSQLLDWNDGVARLKTIRERINSQSDKYKDRLYSTANVKLLTPIPQTMPVWAAGVTYERSTKSRNEEQGDAIKLTKPRASLHRLVEGFAGIFKKIVESVAGAMFGVEAIKGLFDLNEEGQPKSAYDLVYEQDPEKGRPEIFYKAEPGTAAATGEAVTIRPDSELDVPEPELVLVFNSSGKLVGYTMGNDMSSRDIEGQNPLYLPQAKVYYRSTSLGPYLYLDDETTTSTGGKLGDGVKSNWKISMKVFGSNGTVKFKDETTISAIKNTFENLKEHLQKYQSLKNGAALFTGTGITPPASFKLEDGDTVKMTINEIGTLENRVVKTPEIIDESAEKRFATASFVSTVA